MAAFSANRCWRLWKLLLAKAESSGRDHVTTARVVVHDPLALLRVGRKRAVPILIAGLCQFLLEARHEPCCLRPRPRPLATLRATAAILSVHSVLLVGRLPYLCAPLLYDGSQLLLYLRAGEDRGPVQESLCQHFAERHRSLRRGGHSLEEARVAILPRELIREDNLAALALGRCVEVRHVLVSDPTELGGVAVLAAARGLDALVPLPGSRAVLSLPIDVELEADAAELIALRPDSGSRWHGVTRAERALWRRRPLTCLQSLLVRWLRALESHLTRRGQLPVGDLRLEQLLLAYEARLKARQHLRLRRSLLQAELDALP